MPFPRTVRQAFARTQCFALVLFLALFSTHSSATETTTNKITLLASGSSAFTSAEAFMQAVINFFQGPYAMFIAFAGVCVAAFGIMFAKDAGGLIGMGLRIMSGIGVIFAAGSIIGYFS